jgi:xanthine dehydrogenase iron-sulfur cluster and FAD-binding subunit A
MSVLGTAMPRRKPEAEERSLPDGTILKENLLRLGFYEKVIRTTEIAQKVKENTGKSMSRQRVANLLNAIRINPETIQTLAKGLGVKPEELTRLPKK